MSTGVEGCVVVGPESGGSPTSPQGDPREEEQGQEEGQEALRGCVLKGTEKAGGPWGNREVWAGIEEAFANFDLLREGNLF